MDGKKRIVSKGWNITILIVSILAILFNVYMFLIYLHRVGLLAFDIHTAMSFGVYILFILKCIINIIILFLIIFMIDSRNIIFTIYGGFLCVIYTIDVIILAVHNYNITYTLLQTGIFIICMGVMCTGIWLKKSWLVWISFAIYSSYMIFLIISDLINEMIYGLDICFMILLAAFNTHGVNALNKPRKVKQYYNPYAVPMYNANPQMVNPMQVQANVNNNPARAATPVNPMPMQANANNIPVGASASMPSRSNVANAGRTLFSCDNILIDQKVQTFSFGGAYGLYSENGNLVGVVSQEKIGGGAKAAQVLMGRKMRQLQSATFMIYDENNQCVSSLSRKGMGFIDINDSAGNLIGTLKAGKVKAPNGQVIVALKVAGLTTKNIVDETGQVCASFQKKWNGVAKEVFTNADKYLITFTPGLSEYKKIITLSLCIALDFLVSG